MCLIKLHHIAVFIVVTEQFPCKSMINVLATQAYLKRFVRSDTVIGTSKTDRRAAKAGRSTYNVSWEVHNGVNIIRVKSQPNMQ